MSTIASLDDALATLLSITTREMGVDRCSLFLNDTRSDELYSRVAENIHDEIRFPNNAGIAGHVFTSGDGIIVLDAYADKRFNTDVDKATGYKTDSILCAPVKTPTGEIIGVAQALNKLDGSFGQDDMELLEAMTRRASNVLLSTQAQDMAVPGFMRKLQSSVKDCFAAILPRNRRSGNRNRADIGGTFKRAGLSRLRQRFPCAIPCPCIHAGNQTRRVSPPNRRAGERYLLNRQWRIRNCQQWRQADHRCLRLSRRRGRHWPGLLCLRMQGHATIPYFGDASPCHKVAGRHRTAA